MTRRALLGALAVTAGQAATLACAVGGGTAGQSGAAGAAPAAPVKFPATMSIITVSALHSEPGFKAASEEFGRRNNVQVELAPGNPQTVVQTMAAGTPPDVFRRNQGAFSQQLLDGTIRALDSYVQQS